MESKLARVRIIAADTRRAEQLRMFWRGYRDFRKGRFAPYSESQPVDRNTSNAFNP